ncbi:MAG: hypothetical protein VB144_12155 [Clostridia bacterium]|nr:hypothetical protein [Clostridia bacterium]
MLPVDCARHLCDLHQEGHGWELDGDVGGLTCDQRNYSTVLDEPGYNCDFKSTKPGIGVVTATWGDLSDSVTITVTEQPNSSQMPPQQAQGLIVKA